MPHFIALLRGINVGGHNRVPMKALREVCSGLGWKEVRTYVQSGNIVFAASSRSTTLEEQLERAVERHFDVRVPVIVRGREQWLAYIESNPYPDAAEAAPTSVLLALSRRSPQPGAVEEIRGRATLGETVQQVRDAIWIHYPAGAGRSRLAPGVLDRLVGSPVTTRNWRTVVALGELSGSAGGPGDR